ncbi:predicted protein [Plenodomus lingam JN3]|uniref:Predicted protein n=1 Tax=Leptosphaeria maculans (strain JN3 / isolate v23.1.3 / race Av1-4-5-6-7-8) TaxID=985895 RepID=E5R494_LEPMJ|nr:predicted protein [Plenodomus lingam JN3]CBX91862.1 predicted protein [Plenodomus lingam JN3]
MHPNDVYVHPTGKRVIARQSLGPIGMPQFSAKLPHMLVMLIRI